MMYVEVCGKYKGRAECYGVVSAQNFDEAVNKVFANKQLYRSVHKEGANKWRIVGIKQGVYREYTFWVWARKAPQDKVDELLRTEKD